MAVPPEELESHRSLRFCRPSIRTMSSIERHDSLDSLDSYRSCGILEAPTLDKKEIKHAREEALKILKTKSPQEALKIFTEVSEVEADHLLCDKVETATMLQNIAVAKFNGAVQALPKK